MSNRKLLPCTVAHGCHGTTKYLMAQPNISRQNQKLSQKNQINHGKTKFLIPGKTKKIHPKANNSLQNRLLNSRQSQIPLQQNGRTSRQNQNPLTTKPILTHGRSEFHSRSNCHGRNDSFDEVQLLSRCHSKKAAF